MNANCESVSPKQANLLSGPTPTSQSPEVPYVVIEIPGRLPSWNDVLGMEQWARYKFKQQLQETFAFALQLSGEDSSTKTTSARNIILTAAATLRSFMTTARQQRELKFAKKKLEAKSASLFGSKSSNESKVPF